MKKTFPTNISALKVSYLNSIFIILSFFSSSAFTQIYGDKSFFLVDSIKINELSFQDSVLLDSTLQLYHASIEDTTRIKLIAHISDECWDAEIWPKYNQYLIKEISNKFLVGINEVEEYSIISALAGAISNVGFLHDQKGDLLNALEFYHKSLNLYEQIKNENGQSTLFNNLGVIYSMIGDTTNALKYHHQSLRIKKRLNDSTGVAMSYNNIGTVYENSNVPFKALENYELSLKLSEQTNDLRGIAMTLDNIGDIYFSQNMNIKALEYYTKGYDIWSQLGNQLGISTSSDNLSNVLISLNRIDEAKIYALKSFEIANNLNYAIDIENSSKTLSKIYEYEGDYKNALYYNNLYIDYRIKTKSKEINNIALKKSINYEYQKEILKDSLSHQNEIALRELKIKEKETQNYLLYAGMFLLILVLAIGIKSFIQKKADNRKINEQKNEVEKQKLKIENQHIKLAQTHKEISDSINYAKKIQDAILPSKDELNSYLKKGFVMFKPKDVVSGDFYWVQRIKNEIIIAVADCTGHGVPGAIVSVVCNNALNRAVREFHLTEPNKILDKTTSIVIETFEKNDSSENIKDGMDISICNWNINTNLMSWSGANNPLYIIRKGKSKIDIIKPDKQPVGKFVSMQPFTAHQIKLNFGDRFYLFSDGFMDQFGGSEGKKYKYSKFRELLLRNQSIDISNQGEIFETEFENWKGNLEQLDDVCIIGIEVS